MTTANRRGCRRTTAAAALAALVVGGCGGTNAAQSPDDSQPVAAHSDGGARTLNFESQLTSQSPRSAGGGVGSQMVLTGMLFQTSQTDAVGRSQTACTRTAPGAGQVFQCQLSFVFRDGVIYGQSTASAQGPFEGVVTGGTHAYSNVLGTFAYRSTGDSRVNLKLKLR